MSLFHMFIFCFITLSSNKSNKIIFIYLFFPAERAYTPIIFWMCFLSYHAVSVNGARHNNEPAHRHKK